GRASEARLTGTGDTKFIDATIRAYQRAVEADPEHKFLNPLAGLGRMFIKRRQWAEASKWLDLARQVDSRNAEVMRNYGIALQGTGNKSSAIEWLEHSVAIEKNADALRRLGELYADAEIQNGRKAIASYDLAISMAEDEEKKTGKQVE